VDVKNPVVVIATYHSTHLPLAELALSFNSEAKVMIEKPPVTTWEQLARLLELRRAGYFIEIGYNRRHTEYVRQARTLLDTKQGPTTVTCIVRERTIPMTHWYYWPTQGTRIIGNLTHWIDIGIHLIGSRPVSFNTMSSSLRFPADDVSISVHFEDGSQLNLISTDRGNPLRGIQEYIDIRKDDLTIKIDDFLHLTVQEGGRERSSSRLIRDKGHKRMYQDFLDKCLNGAPASYPEIDLERTCGLYLSLKEALLRGERSGEITSLSPTLYSPSRKTH
jgi:predicted dehydrogenase